jgi:hypothetical protein
MLTTGIIPGQEGESSVVSAGGEAGAGPLPGIGEAEGQMINNIIQRAYGARFAQRRVPNEE